MKQFKTYLSVLVFVLISQLSFAEGSSLKVYFFLSETCPICQAATVTIKNLHSEYKEKGVEFVGIFPNISMSDTSSMAQFGQKYGLTFPLLLDTEQALTKRFGATITPQIFVVEESTQTVIYKGKIDNGFERVGRKRQVTTAHYLKNAMDQWLQKQPITISETEPVGCFIVKK